MVQYVPAVIKYGYTLLGQFLALYIFVYFSFIMLLEDTILQRHIRTEYYITRILFALFM